MMECARTGSRLATGSSASMISGSCIIARAIPTRCCWPPLSSSARLFACSGIPTRASCALAISISSLEKRLMRLSAGFT